MPSPIRLIVGLGNPGKEYEQTRHNAGAWFVQRLAEDHHVVLRHETKFNGFYANFLHDAEKIHLLIPTTFMNHSGQAIKAVTDFYKIPAENMLIAHDELDIPLGEIRLKFAGGHGGHNGLRDTVAHLHTHDFYRLRIGVDHPGPGQKHLVTDYLLSPPSKAQKKIIEESFERAIMLLPFLLNGENEKAMQLLHTKPE